MDGFIRLGLLRSAPIRGWLLNGGCLKSNVKSTLCLILEVVPADAWDWVWISEDPVMVVHIELDVIPESFYFFAGAPCPSEESIKVCPQNCTTMVQ
jgi:hypothetical protein